MSHPGIRLAKSEALTTDHAREVGLARRSTAPCSQASIDVRNLRLRTFIGFNVEERTKRQDIVVNMLVKYDVHPGVFDDSVDRALNYKTITKRVIDHVENGRFLLLEKLAGDVLAISSDDPSVNHARVTIDKPHALRFADSVSVSLEYYREPNDVTEENSR